MIEQLESVKEHISTVNFTPSPSINNRVNGHDTFKLTSSLRNDSVREGRSLFPQSVLNSQERMQEYKFNKEKKPSRFESPDPGETMYPNAQNTHRNILSAGNHLKNMSMGSNDHQENPLISDTDYERDYDLVMKDNNQYFVQNKRLDHNEEDPFQVRDNNFMVPYQVELSDSKSNTNI